MIAVNSVACDSFVIGSSVLVGFCGVFVVSMRKRFDVLVLADEVSVDWSDKSKQRTREDLSCADTLSREGSVSLEGVEPLGLLFLLLEVSFA